MSEMCSASHENHIVRSKTRVLALRSSQEVLGAYIDARSNTRISGHCMCFSSPQNTPILPTGDMERVHASVPGINIRYNEI
jgi:hypothetical protein